MAGKVPVITLLLPGVSRYSKNDPLKLGVVNAAAKRAVLSRVSRAIKPALAPQARLELVPTANAAASDRTLETRGMVIHSAVPVFSADGVQVGVLEGGVLLNQNLGFVDEEI